MPIYHLTPNLFYFDCETTLESVPGPTSTKQWGYSFLHSPDRLRVRRISQLRHAAPVYGIISFKNENLNQTGKRR